jgi:hypothetical protein
VGRRKKGSGIIFLRKERWQREALKAERERTTNK